MNLALSPWRRGCLPLWAAVLVWTQAHALAGAPPSGPAGVFEGQHYRGAGDVEYLRLLETARRMFEPDPELQNLSMLYTPKWNGLVEGPTWDAWWIQNSYGTTYAILPFLQEPFVTFLQNAQDLWFDQMGDGRRVGAPPPFNWVAPDGCLCDAARPGWIVYKQGDGRTAIHDWAVEFTAAGVVLQAEALLISRDTNAITRYLPKLERSVAFVETRRDPRNNLFLAGPAANLLAPSYAGWRRPDGTYGQGYLAGLSISQIAALDRVIELEKLVGRGQEASAYIGLRDSAKAALPLLMTPEGYFVKSIDPDGTRHGVLYAPRFGYFEAPPNHDAIAFRVVDDPQAEKIYQQIAALPGLRPYDFILPNYPGYDDMYEKPEGLWRYGEWVNGGHWSTCEARMVLGYYRLGNFEDARRSMKRLLTFAERFRMDNPLTRFGSAVYQPNQPINLCYDTFGPAAAFLRGLFEFLYRADGLTLVPHIPPGLARLEQTDPVRFGNKQLYLSVAGSGPITAVRINGKLWQQFDRGAVSLPYDTTPDRARIQIILGDGSVSAKPAAKHRVPRLPAIREKQLPSEIVALDKRAARMREFSQRLAKAKLGNTYEAAHVRLVLDCVGAVHLRHRLELSGELKLLPGASQTAADQAYWDAAARLGDGLESLMKQYAGSSDPVRRKIFQLWEAASK